MARRVFENLAADDTLIWEYALNDMNYIDFKQHDEDLLLKFVEYTILTCQKHGVRFVPLILTSMRREKQVAQGRYQTALKALFTHYGLEPIDISQLFRAHLGVKTLPVEHYAEPAHYSAESPIIPFIAQKVIAAIPQAQVPAKAARVYVAAGKELSFIKSIRRGTKRKFTNHFVSVQTTVMGETGLTLAPFTAAGTVVALLHISTPSAGAARIKIGQETYHLSLTYKEPVFNKPLLKCMSLEMACEDPVRFEAGDVMRIHRSPRKTGLLHDYGYRKVTTHIEKIDPELMFVGFLCEVDV